ncbi:MFS transporter [Methanocella arvoryzae]|uniref:MFS transporter n=1 Tax=Methanocella arvoryzae TaxID=1175445 RepID=UPI0003242BD4|nr:MFS transporter [Methanocella arvoryzae]
MYSIGSYISRVRQFTPNARKFLAYEFFLALNAGIYGVIFNLYVLKLGYHEDFLGLILSVMSVSTGLFALPAAIVCDRIGRKNTLVLSSILLAVALALLYTIATGWMLLFMGVCYGIAMAFSIVAGNPFMAENSSGEERMYLFSMNSVVYTVAAIFGNLCGGMLPTVIAGAAGVSPEAVLPYRYTLYLSLIAVLITLVPLAMIKENRPPVADRSERLRMVAQVIRTPTVQRLVAVNILIGIGAGMIVPFFNVYFHKVLAAPTEQIGVIFSIGQVTMIIGLLLIPLLTERVGKVRTIAITQLLSIPFLILIAVTTNIYLAGFAYVMRMTFMNMANPAISNFNMELLGDRERATVSSLTSMGWYLFLALSTYVSGIMMANDNYLLPYMITCVVYLLAAVAYYVFFMKIEREKESSASAVVLTIQTRKI